MADKVRRISERSLENLKLGAESRRQGKVRHNFTILPETVQWLKGTGNASDAIDVLVEAAKNNNLFSNNTHDQKEQELVISNSVYEQKVRDLEISLEETYLELQKTRNLLEASKKSEQIISDLHSECLSDGFKAANILKEALPLKASAGGAIKKKIKEALELIDDV